MNELQRVLSLVQLMVGALMVVAILSQNKGTGLSTVFGGSGAIHRTKRGLEKWLFYTTIALAVSFVALSVAVVLVS
jgi:protein translocase SecG subunit